MKRFLTLLFLLVLTPAFVSPCLWAMARKPPAPTGSISGSDSFNQGDVKPLTLHDCYAFALRQSEQLAIRGVNVEKTWANFLDATSEALGDVSFEMTQFKQKEIQTASADSGGVGGDFTRSLRRERKFVIDQPIFKGFKALGGMTGAGSLRKQRIGEKARAEQLLFMDVATAFYSVLRYEKEIQITKEIINLFDKRLRELADREKIGRSRPSESVTAKARMKTIAADLALQKGQWAYQKRFLEFLTGISLENRTLEDESTTDHPPDPLDFYLISAPLRPDVQALKQSIKTAFGGIITAQSGLWPELNLNTNVYEKREGFQEGIDWDVLFTIDVPLFTGGETMGEIKAAQSEWKKAKLLYQESVRMAELEIKQAYVIWFYAFERFKALEEAVSASEENYSLQEEDYRRSLVNNLDVLAALELLNETRLELNEAQYRLKEEYWQMQVATGKCCELS